MPPDVGLCAQLACVWEATARKPGNVHRYRDFDDLTYLDFVVSSVAIAPALATAGQRRVGATILECVRATRQVIATNSNLGIVLLLTPLAAVPPAVDLRAGVVRVLNDLDIEDSRLAYQAIRLANPGGLGAAPDQDVAAEPTCTLRQAMELAANRDVVARQYSNGFREVFDDCVPALTKGIEQTGSMEGAIIWTQLHLMARHPDTLIARKRGAAEAAEAGQRAEQVLTAGWPESESGRHELANFDAWLRNDGHARNPGATADIIAAGLFVLLREARIPFPLTIPWSLRQVNTDQGPPDGNR